jgi:flagellar protein FlaG
MANTIFAQSTVKPVGDQEKLTSPERAVLPNEKTEGVSSAQATVNKTRELEKQSEDQAEAVQEKVAELNSYMQHLNRKLQFSVDDQSGNTVVKVIDSETDELIRQVPAQEILDVKNAINEYRGLLFETKA